MPGKGIVSFCRRLQTRPNFPTIECRSKLIGQGNPEWSLAMRLEARPEGVEFKHLKGMHGNDYCDATIEFPILSIPFVIIKESWRSR